MARQFKDLDAFATFLARRAGIADRAGQAALKREARAVAEAAKSLLGEYQEGWKPLAAATQAARAKAGYTPNDPLLASGELKKSIGFSAEGRRAVAGSTSPYAAAQELGTSRIPPRPFLGLAAHRRSRTVAKNVAEATVAALAPTNRRET